MKHDDLQSNDQNYSVTDDAELESFFDELRKHQPAPPSNLALKLAKLAEPASQADTNIAWLGWLSSPWRGAATCLIPLAIGFGLGFGDVLSPQDSYEIDSLLYVASLDTELADSETLDALNGVDENE